MEYVEGESLERDFGSLDKRLPVERLLSIAIEISDALEAAHAIGIIHGDIKPSNIFITQSGHVKILNFGPLKLSQVVVRPLTSGISLYVSYISPEELIEHAINAQSDLFSFGAVLFKMAIGTPPFHGSTTTSVFKKILHHNPTEIYDYRQFRELKRIITKALEKDPSLRYQSAKEMKDDLMRLNRDLYLLYLPRSLRSGYGEVKVIRVFFATDRQRTASRVPKCFFQNERAKDGKLSLGICEVSISESDRHKVGHLEKPSIFGASGYLVAEGARSRSPQ